MNKKVKNGIIFAAGGAAAVIGTAEIIYESILNMKLMNKMKSVFNIDDPRLKDIFLKHPLFLEGYEWYKKMNPIDTPIVNKSGELAHGYILKNEGHTDKWAICIHGFCGSPKAQSPYAKHFYEMGYSVIFPHMRGHECDDNYCSMGYRDKDNIICWINYITANYPDSQIILHGVSMGAAATMMVTGEPLPTNVKCAVSDCGFSSCWDEYIYEMKTLFHLPALPMLYIVNAISKCRGNFDFKKCSAVDAVKKSKTPTLFIHGTEDDFVPYAMLNEVYSACAAEKDRLDVQGALHAVSVAVDTEGYFKKTDSFVEKYVK